MSELKLPNLQSKNAFGICIQDGPAAPSFERVGPETRIYRAPVRAFGKIEVHDKTIFGLVLNISAEGCLLKTESSLEQDTPVVLTISIVGGEKRRTQSVKGFIRRKTETDGRTAYGIEFSRENENRKVAETLYSDALLYSDSPVQSATL